MAAAGGFDWSERRILLGVTGAIGAVAIPDLLAGLRRSGVGKLVVLISENAERFVTPLSLQLLAGGPVYGDIFDGGATARVPHIQLTREADLFVIAPATANILAKAAAGIGDDLISTAILAAKCPVLFAPSMNESMWTNPIVKRSVRTLREVGLEVLEPGEGIEVADFRATQGVMPSPRKIMAEMAKLLSRGEPGRA